MLFNAMKIQIDNNAHLQLIEYNRNMLKFGFVLTNASLILSSTSQITLVICGLLGID